jgi:hypothetical protein
MGEPNDKLLDKRVLTVPEIAKLCGLDRSTVNRHDREGKIATYAKRVPGYKQGRYRNSEGLRHYIDIQKRRKARKERPSRAGRSSQFRDQAIEWLAETLDNQREVSAKDKELALQYLNCRCSLWYDSLMLMRARFPLLQAVHAALQNTLRGGVLKNAIRKAEFCDYVESAIERLPTRPETKPQTEQFDLNV